MKSIYDIRRSRAVEEAQAMIDRGECSSLEANIEIVRSMGVQIVTCKMPRDVRQTLNAAVKAGRLGHLPKKDFEPEAYFHPNAKGSAREEQQRIARETLDRQHTALKSILA